MLWLVCFSLFALSSAFPFQATREGNQLEKYNVQLVEYKGLPHQRHSLCLPSPFLRQICFPSALQFFIPFRTLEWGRRRCLSIPIMRAYVIRVCPPTDSVSKEENSNASLKEVIKEVVTEAEEERLPDNTNIEVNGGEAEPKFFVKNDFESEVEDEESKNKINFRQTLSHESLEQTLDDENLSITSNLV